MFNPDTVVRIDENHVAIGFNLDIEMLPHPGFETPTYPNDEQFYYCESCGVDFAEHELIECFEIDNSYFICPDCKVEVYNHNDYVF
ncbi:MAG: hypothetical protein ACFFDN_05225 [Candidatus Hodarchaeota archaeon]